ncbi:hypothetical protein MMC29_001659 [Sticta canariensis]|nr:hypothetical protein [Sticta canariensis]
MESNPQQTFELSLEPDAELAQPDALPFDTALIRQCKITSSITHARYGLFKNKRACLVGLSIQFLPHHSVRFKYVEVQARLLKPKLGSGDTNDNISPSIIAYEPKRWQGKSQPKSVQKSAHFDANTGLPTAIATGVDLGISAGLSKGTEHTEPGRAWILSAALNAMTVEWRLCENAVAQEGSPNPLQVATIVECGPKFSLRLSFQVKLSKSVDPLSWRAAHARLTKPLDFNSEELGATGLGPDVHAIEKMDSDEFQLQDLVICEWDL